MNGIVNSRLRHPVTRLHRLIIILAVLAVVTLATAPVNAQQVVFNICDRTQEVQDAILGELTDSPTCSTVTETQLAGIKYFYTDGYSSASIVPGDFADLTGLMELGILNSTELTTVQANAFSEMTGYSELYWVSLGGNAITDVDVDAFDGLSGVTEIFLSNNSIETLEPGVFDGVSSLTTLVLTENYIQNLEGGVIDGLTGLTYLSLGNNGLRGLDNAVFSALTQLEILYLGGNDLSELDADTFNGLSHLQQLSLNSNGLSDLPVGIFNGLTELKQLYLGGNPFTELDADTFADLGDSLWHLYLNNNSRLSTLPSGIFYGLTGLRTLDLAGNNFSTLPANIFGPLDDSLTAMALSRNRISSLDAGIFDGLTGLKSLHLSDNSLSSLDVGIFEPLDDSLQDLYLSNNNFSSLRSDTFDGLDGLVGLYIENNESLSSLPPNIFEDLDESLLYLYLGNNSLSSLDADIFDGLTGLEHLYLNDNSLSSLPADIFDGLAGLQRLYLNHNSLPSLPATIFEDLDDSLWHLVLTRNTIATLPANIFGGLTGLRGLDLSCNSLSSLPLDRFDPFASSLTYLDVSGNSYGATPSEMALRDKFAQITDMSGSLWTGANTECLPPYEFGLSGLNLSTGTLSRPFEEPGSDTYRARVDHDVSSITVSVTPKDSRAVIEPRSGSSFAYDNDPNTPGIQVVLHNARTNIGWQVRVRNGAFASPYQMSVYRDPPPATNALLRSLELSNISLESTFDGRIDTYSATTATSETIVTATPLDPDATTVIKLNGTVDADGNVDLRLGENVITVEVTAEDGTTMKTYTVTVIFQGTVSFGSEQYYVTEGDEVEVTVELSTALPGNVVPITLPLLADNVSSMSDDYTVPETITFGANETTVSFTITANQDSKEEGDESFVVSFTLPQELEDILIFGDTYTTTVNIVDGNTPGMTVTPRTLAVDEGDTAMYTVKLNTAPSDDVSVWVNSTDTGAATVAPAMLTFTSDTWAEPQEVTVTGVEDSDQDNESVTLVNHPDGGDYGNVRSVDVALNVIDNDNDVIDDDDETPGITIMPRTLTVTEGDATGDSYTMVLDSQPTASVTVTMGGFSGTDVSANPATLTFTTGNWQTAQTVTVTAGDDGDMVNDSVTLTHSAASSDGAYDGIPIASVTVTVSDDDMTDDDTPGITIMPRTLTLTVTEEDTTGAGYTVVLDTLPTATVTVTVAGHTGTDVTPSPITLTFTRNNWGTAQTVTVTAGDDADEANDTVTLTHSATSTDADYHDIMIASVRVTVSDNDRSPTTTTGGGGGGFGPALTAPSFVDGFRTSRPLYENAQPGDAVGDPVAATHPNDDTVTYSLSGANASLFTVDEETGQIRLGQAVSLELGQTYTVNLTATDSSGTGAIIIVDIAVAEAPYHRYDLNRNGSIEKNEVLAAVGDYFLDVIEKPLVLEVVSLYFAG